MWTERKKILLLVIVFHIHFVTIQTMLSLTLIGRSHIWFFTRCLKQLKGRVRRGEVCLRRVRFTRGGGGEVTGQTTKVTKKTSWPTQPFIIWFSRIKHQLQSPPGWAYYDLNPHTHTSHKAQCTLNLILHKLQQSRHLSKWSESLTLILRKPYPSRIQNKESMTRTNNIIRLRRISC